MYLRVIRGIINVGGVPYVANTSQALLSVDDTEGARLIESGCAEQIDSLPERHVPVASEPSDVIRARIHTLETNATEFEFKKALLLAQDIKAVKDADVVLEQISAIDGKISSLRVLIETLRKKLAEAEAAERLKAEGDQIKIMEKTAKDTGVHIRNALQGIVDSISALDSHLGAITKLSHAVEAAWVSAGGEPGLSPLLSVMSITLPDDQKGALTAVRTYIKGAAEASLPRIDSAVIQAPRSLKAQLQLKHFKNEEELLSEARAYYEAHKDDPRTYKIEPWDPKDCEWVKYNRPTVIDVTPGQAIRAARAASCFE